MRPYDKVRQSIDWNNVYTIQKTLNTLKAEFYRALQANNTKQAKYMLNIVQRLYDDFSTSFKEGAGKGETMSYAQKTMAKRMRAFIVWMDKQTHSKSRNTQIKHIIEGEQK